ncbi:unnamed protein product [Caretta caretta]
MLQEQVFDLHTLLSLVKALDAFPSLSFLRSPLATMALPRERELVSLGKGNEGQDLMQAEEEASAAVSEDDDEGKGEEKQERSPDAAILYCKDTARMAASGDEK